MSYSEKFGETVKIHRKLKGYTQEKLAEESNLSVHQISDIENGKANPKLDTIIKLCKVCCINIGELILLLV